MYLNFTEQKEADKKLITDIKSPTWIISLPITVVIYGVGPAAGCVFHFRWGLEVEKS